MSGSPFFHVILRTKVIPIMIHCCLVLLDDFFILVPRHTFDICYVNCKVTILSYPLWNFGAVISLVAFLDLRYYGILIMSCSRVFGWNGTDLGALPRLPAPMVKCDCFNPDLSSYLCIVFETRTISVAYIYSYPYMDENSFFQRWP